MTLGTAVDVCLGLIAAGQEASTHPGLETVFTVVGFIVGFLVAIAAQPIRNWLVRPKLVIQYVPEEGSILPTPTTGRKQVSLPTSPRKGSTTTIVSRTRQYVRLRVRNANMTRMLAANCAAYLVRLERRGLHGGSLEVFHECIPFAWSYRTKSTDKGSEFVEQIDIPHGVSAFLSLVYSEQDDSRFHWTFACPTPLLLQDMAEKPGVLVLTIVVAGDRAAPQRMKLEFTWNGKWDDFKVKEIKAACVRASDDDEMVQTYWRCLRSRWESLKNTLKKLP